MPVGGPNQPDGGPVQRPVTPTPAEPAEGRHGSFRVKEFLPVRLLVKLMEVIGLRKPDTKSVHERTVTPLPKSQTAKGVLPEYLGKVEDVRLKDMQVRVSASTGEEIKLGSGVFGEVFEGVKENTEDLRDGAGPDKLQRQMVIKKIKLTGSGRDKDKIIRTSDKENELQSRVRETPLVQGALLSADSSEYHIALENGGSSMLSLLQRKEVDGQQTVIDEAPWQPMPEQQVKELGWQLASQVAKVHGEGICHKDIKPENILIDNKGKVTLIDFGQSLKNMPASGNPDEAKFGFGGTPGYMDPLALGDDPLTLKSDIWSFGMVLIEMLTGEDPFSFYGGQNRDVFFDVEGLKKHRRNVFNSNSLSPEAKDLVLKMTNLNPATRPTAQEVLDHPFFKQPSTDEMNMQQLQIAHSQAFDKLAEAESRLEKIQKSVEGGAVLAEAPLQLDQAEREVKSYQLEVKLLQANMELLEVQREVEKLELANLVFGEALNDFDEDSPDVKDEISQFVSNNVRFASPHRQELQSLLSQDDLDRNNAYDRIIGLLNEEYQDHRAWLDSSEQDVARLREDIQRLQQEADNQ